MIQIPGYPPCWVASVTMLPNFYDPETLICGEFCAYMSDLYEPFQMLVRQGRNLFVHDGLSKYKLEVQCRDGVADVVCIATMPFDPNNIFNPDYTGIGLYPIYTHFGRNALLYVDSINALFSDTHMVCTDGPGITSAVESPMGFIKRIDDLQMKSAYSAEYDFRYARMQRPDQLISLFSSVQNSYSDDSAVRSGLEVSYGITSDHVPMELQIVGEIRNVGMLRQLLNPYGNVPSDIARRCAFDSVVFDEAAGYLMEHGCLPTRCGDVYQNDAEDFSLVGALLGKIYEIPSNSFEFPVRLDERDCFDLYAMKCNVYNDFKHSFERINDWSIITSCLTGGFNLDSMSGEFPSGWRELKAQRTWLEDIVVKDPNDNILLYIDMTWWILACSDGLINSSVLDSVTFS